MAVWWRFIRQKLEIVNRAVLLIFSVTLFSFVYILILPWFAVFAKKGKKRLRHWVSWTLTSETIDDLKKQY